MPATTFRAQAGELVEWLEDVVQRGAPLTVSLGECNDHTRAGALRRFYSQLAEHRAFGGAWPVELPAHGLVPDVPPTVLGGAPGFYWLAVSSSPEPLAEQAQLAEQLSQYINLPEPVAWLDMAAVGGFKAVLYPHDFESIGHRIDCALAMFGAPVDEIATGVRAATRALDELVNSAPLLRDGGALELDAPRAEARALVLAAWIERLANLAPVVFVVDDVSGASDFLRKLVDLISHSRARVLVVLAGRSRDDALSYDSVHSPDLVRTAAAAAVSASSAFSTEQLQRIHNLVSSEPFERMLRQLAAGNWIRPLTRDIWTFTSDDLRLRLKTMAPSLVGRDNARLAVQLAATPGPPARVAHPLERLLQLECAAENDPAGDAAWEYARSLASWGELQRAIEVGERVEPSLARREILSVWRRSSCMPAESLDSGSLASSIMRAASSGSSAADRARIAAALEHAAALAHTDADDLLAEELTLRAAAFRALLFEGDINAAVVALGETAFTWLSFDSKEQLAALVDIGERPLLVARSAKIIENLYTIVTLREISPDSAALGLAYLQRLDLLEQIGRLDDAHDAVLIATEAERILERFSSLYPRQFVRARKLACWVNLRHIRDLRAIDQLDELTVRLDALPLAPVERRRLLLEVGASKARAISEYVDAKAGLVEYDALLTLVDSELGEYDPISLDVAQWRGECLGILNRFGESAEELHRNLARRLERESADGEGVLTARLRYACALADGGRGDEAMAHFDEVVERRSRIDGLGASRLVTSIHARAACKRALGQFAEALDDLEAVLIGRETHLAVSHPAVSTIMRERAECLMLLGRWNEALDAFTQLIVGRDRIAALDLLTLRQQRALCLIACNRPADAAFELDLAAGQALRLFHPDHELVVGIMAVRNSIAGAQSVDLRVVLDDQLSS